MLRSHRIRAPFEEVPILTLLVAVASAQSLGQLPYGTHADLSSCLQTGGETCARAATYLGAPWSEPITSWATGRPTQAPASDLSSSKALEQSLLACVLNADQCEDAAARLDVPATRMEATFLHLEACRQGTGTACDDLGVKAYTRQGAAGPTSLQQENWRIAPGFVPPIEVTNTLIETCDGTDAAAAHDACFTLAAVGNGLRAKPERHTQFMNHLRVACADGSPSSCAVVSAWEEPDVPMVQALETLYPLLNNLCQVGTAGVACEAAARSLELGRPTVFGTPHSLRLHGYACDEGVKPGCKNLDRTYKTPYASDEINRSCQAAKSGTGGEGLACSNVYSQLKFGVGRTKDVEAAEALREQLCDLGDYRPCRWLGWDAWQAEEFKRSLAFYNTACELGEPNSCAFAGNVQLWGSNGVPKSSGGLAKLKKGCDALSSKACANLGVALYDPESGITQDLKAAYKAFDRACALGNTDGCAYLGGMKLFEQGTTKDVEGGLWLLDRACSDGSGDACRVIGDAYKEGAVSPHPASVPRARHAYKRGCDLEFELACERLAEVGDGESVKPHPGARPSVTAQSSSAAKAKRTIVPGSYSAPGSARASVEPDASDEVTIRRRPHPTVTGFLVRDLGSNNALGHDGSFGLQVSHGFKGFGWGLQFLREDWSFGPIDTVELTVERGLFHRGFANYKLSFGIGAYASGGYVLNGEDGLGASVGADVSLGIRLSRLASFTVFWRPVKPFGYGADTANELYLQNVRQDIGLSYTF